MRIPSSHERAIATTLKGVEDTLCNIEGLMERRDCERILTRDIQQLSSIETNTLKECIGEIRKIIKYIADELGLEKREDNVRGKIIGTLIIKSINLEEIKSKRLRGYGEVPDELREFLDPQIDKMMRLVDEICKIASSKDKKTEIQREKP